MGWASELRVARRSAGLSQSALGRLVSVSAATVGGYELGRRPVPVALRAALESVLNDYWPGRGQGGSNVTDEQDGAASDPGAAGQISPEEVLGAAEEAAELEDAEELREAVDEAVEEAVDDIVDEAQEAIEEAVEEAVEEAEAELDPLVNLSEELRQLTQVAGRRAGRKAGVEAELLLGPVLADVYRQAFVEGIAGHEE